MEEDEVMTNPDYDCEGNTPVICEAPPPSVEEDGHELKIRRIHLQASVARWTLD